MALSTAFPSTAAASHAPVRSIVVLRPNIRLGNTLLLTPLVQELEARFPEASISLVTGSGAAASLFRSYPGVGAHHYFSSSEPSQIVRALHTLATLRRTSFDLAIDPIPRSRTGRFLLQYVQARERVGFRWGETRRDRSLTHAADPRDAPAHLAQSPIWMLRSSYLHLESAGADPVAMDLRLTEAERQHGERRLAASLGSGTQPGSAEWRARPKVGLFAHATGEKRYPLEWWRQLIGCFRGSRVQFLEFVPEDATPRLAGEIPGVFTPDLRVLGATLAATSLVVIADGGVMHLAEAAGAPVLGLFRTTQPAHYAPLRAGSEGLWARDLGVEAVAARIRELLYGATGQAVG